jgi:hypothetical protein
MFGKWHLSDQPDFLPTMDLLPTDRVIENVSCKYTMQLRVPKAYIVTITAPLGASVARRLLPVAQFIVGV